MAARGAREVDQVRLQRRGHVHGPGRVDHVLHVVVGDHAADVAERVVVAMAVEDLELLLGGRVPHRHPHEEPVELRLGQRIGALVLDRVLGGDHHERAGQRVGRAVDRHLRLPHGLEEGRLGLRRRAVDLIGEDDVPEHGSGPELELAVVAVPHRDAHHIGGQQVGGELQAAEGAVDRGGQRLGQAGLAHPRHVLDEQVPLGDQAQQHELDHLGFALDDPLDVVEERAVVVGEGLSHGGLTGGQRRAPRNVARPRQGRPRPNRSDAAVSLRRAAWVGCAAVDRVLAVDVGGTKMAAGVVTADGDLLARSARPTPQGADAEAVLRALLDAVAEVRTGEESVCGVGSGGPMTRGGESVSPLNIPGWRDFPLRARLSASMGLPVHIDNDAKALALGEGWRGAARGERNYLAMVVSTGVGGGIVLDGRLLDGEDSNAGHIGHVIVEPDGRVCPCGAQGCLEAEASGTAITARTGAPPAEAPDAERRRAGCLVGRAVASVASLLDLRLAVVAGSVALGYGGVFFDAAQRELAARARLEFASGARIRPAGLGDEGPLIGAAAVALQATGHGLLD